MKDSDWLMPIFCIAWIMLVTYQIVKAKRSNPQLNIKEFLKSETLFIPGFIVFIIMITRISLKIF